MLHGTKYASDKGESAVARRAARLHVLFQEYSAYAPDLALPLTEFHSSSLPVASRAMMAAQQVTLAALENQAFALMSRLHVIMRRETGRVTDIEYMRVDPHYCRHVLGLAEATGKADLHDICLRLGDIYFAPGGLFPPAKKQPAPRAPEPAAPGGAGDAPVLAALTPKAKAVQSYVGRLR